MLYHNILKYYLSLRSYNTCCFFFARVLNYSTNSLLPPHHCTKFLFMRLLFVFTIVSLLWDFDHFCYINLIILLHWTLVIFVKWDFESLYYMGLGISLLHKLPPLLQGTYVFTTWDPCLISVLLLPVNSLSQVSLGNFGFG